MLYAILTSLAYANLLERMSVLKDLNRLGASVLDVTWTDCGGLSKVTSLEPSTLTLGKTTTVTGKGNMPEVVSGGSYDIKLTAGFINENWKGDICAAKTFDLPLGMGSVKFVGMSCPIAKGSSSLSMDITMSSLIPEALASATIKVTATDSSGAQLLCLNMNTKPKAELERRGGPGACINAKDEKLFPDIITDMTACGESIKKYHYHGLKELGKLRECMIDQKGFTNRCTVCMAGGLGACRARFCSKKCGNPPKLYEQDCFECEAGCALKGMKCGGLYGAPMDVCEKMMPTELGWACDVMHGKKTLEQTYKELLPMLKPKKPSLTL